MAFEITLVKQLGELTCCRKTRAPQPHHHAIYPLVLPVLMRKRRNNLQGIRSNRHFQVAVSPFMFLKRRDIYIVTKTCSCLLTSEWISLAVSNTMDQSVNSKINLSIELTGSLLMYTSGSSLKVIQTTWLDPSLTMCNMVSIACTVGCPNA